MNEVSETHKSLALANEHRLPSIEEVLQCMLTEDTGKHPLDSGGENGRGYDHQRARGFENREMVRVRVDLPHGFDPESLGPEDVKVVGGRKLIPWSDDMYLDVEVDAYSYLVEIFNSGCETAPFYGNTAHDLTKSLHRFGFSPEHKNTDWFECVDLWIEHFNENEAGEAGAYDVGKLKAEEPFNTYNGEVCTDVVWWGVLLHDEERNDYYVVLRSHNGADVRGGYSTPYVFEVGYDSVAIEPVELCGYDGDDDGGYVACSEFFCGLGDVFQWIDTDRLEKLIEAKVTSGRQGSLFAQVKADAGKIENPLDQGLWMVDYETCEIVSTITGKPIEFSAR